MNEYSCIQKQRKLISKHERLTVSHKSAGEQDYHFITLSRFHHKKKNNNNNDKIINENYLLTAL